MPTLQINLLLCLLASFVVSNNALIVSSPGPYIAENGLAGRPPVERLTKERVARIRSTRRSDIDTVSELLSSAIAGGGNNHQNFKARMERLRIQASVKSTLDLRVRAIEEGRKYLTQRVSTIDGNNLALEVYKDPVYLRYLWSRDSFRNKIAQAAQLTSEPTPWEHHNFALAPEDPSWLRHEMITAEDTITGEIVGFCEVAMLLCPSTGDDYEEFCNGNHCAPTIANLVVAPEWRGRGVGKGLVNRAERVVQRRWNGGELGLYVEKRNLRALNLYSRAGYQVMASVPEANQLDKWYMSKSL